MPPNNKRLLVLSTLLINSLPKKIDYKDVKGRRPNNQPEIL